MQLLTSGAWAGAGQQLQLVQGSKALPLVLAFAWQLAENRTRLQEFLSYAQR